MGMEPKGRWPDFTPGRGDVSPFWAFDVCADRAAQAVASADDGHLQRGHREPAFLDLDRVRF
jgi:hypothetical protein